MSSLRQRLQQQLQRFDDEAFVALANRGLLRRAYKDLESQSASIEVESADSLTVAFGGHRIEFDSRGPAFARCSCPAAGVCQHVLAAAIGLRGIAAPDSAPVAKPDLDAQLAALASIGMEAMRKHAGLPGYRWAWQHVHDIELPRDLEVGGESHVVLTLARPRVTFRQLGEGLDGLVADLDSSHLPKYRVAAVLAFQRASGRTIQPPPTTTRAATLDLGQDHALAAGNAATREGSRARIRASVRGLLRECMELGLSHLSEAVQQRFATQAVWAQGAEYYRLAMLLRRLADQVDLLLERAGAADEHALLDDMSLALALVSALERAAASGIEAPALIGRSRTSYEESAKLDLVGLGALPWRSQTGYHGLTMLLWSTQRKGFVSCTDARPEQQRGFSPRTRYTQAGPWSGLGAPAQASGRRIELSGARLNPQGRLSANESASAVLTPETDGARLLAELRPFNRWTDVREHWDSARRSLLSEPDPMRDWVLLSVATFGGAQFDQVRQLFELALLDTEGESLPAEMTYSELNEAAVERLEGLGKHPPREGAHLLGRLRNSDGRLVIEPLSLLRVEASGVLVVDALHFDDAPSAAGSVWTSMLDRFRSRAAAAAPPSRALRSDPVPPALRAVREWLCRRAERGLSGVPAALDLDTYTGLRERAEFAGLACLPELSGEVALGEQLLRANYIYLQYLRLIGAFDAEPEETGEGVE